MSTYGAAAAKSQNDERAVLVQQPGDRVGVGDDAGDVARPPRTSRSCSGRSAYRSSSRAQLGRGRCGRRRPRGWSTTSAIDSRQGSSLEWCSYGPMNTTGPLVGAGSARTAGSGRRGRRGSAARGCRPACRSRRSRPEPQKITTVSSSPPTASWIDRAGVLAQPGGLQAGAAALGVGVGVAGEHLVADEVLDERAPGPRPCSRRTSPGAGRTARASPGRRR